MPNESLVVLQQASVTYRRLRDPTLSIKEFAFQSLKRKTAYNHFAALQDVTLRVRRGEILGVIGRNGAGKSTLLKLLAGILPPTSGRVVVRGILAPLIELGAGFDLDMTGSENVVLYGSFLGGDVDALRRQVPAIADWAGLDEFMDVPLRKFSSGMLTRLALAVAAECDPDVLLIDEVLAVGDEAFQAKSRERIEDLLSKGSAVILVSHSLDQVAAMADRILWLEAGRLVACGNPAAVLNGYRLRSQAMGTEATAVAGR